MNWDAKHQRPFDYSSASAVANAKSLNMRLRSQKLFTMLAIATIATATQAKGFGELINSRVKQNTQSCMPGRKATAEP